MNEYHDLVESLTWLLTHKLQARSEYTHGILGNGQGHVEVPNRPDYNYVRPDRYSDRVYEVFNKRVSGADGTPVLIGELPWQPGLTQVIAVDWDAYLDVGWGDATPGLPPHGRSHEWLDGAPGFDTFNVYRRQVGELKTHPIGSGTPSVYVSAYNFTHMESLKSWPGLPGLDLTNAVPTTTGSARLALVYWDPCSGTTGMLGVATGTIDVDSPAIALNRPAAPAGTIPSAWVRLAGGQNDITEFDIYDARPLWMPTLEFATGSCGIWAGIIPIGDPGDHFTGSTVESALEEIVDMGGGPPSGPAGGDLTGTYPNPIVDGLLTRPLGLNPVAEGHVLMWTGSFWQPHPQTAQVPTGPAGGDLTGTYPDPLVAGLYGSPLLPVAPDEGDVLMFTGSVWRPLPHPVTADAWAFKVKNTSGAFAAAHDVGYIDENGEYKTTTTAYADVKCCVVLVGGSNNDDIYIARRGRVIITLNGDCSAGDYLYTSTTAGQAQPESYVRPELFGVALTVNGAGAGGTCEALLLTERNPRPLFDDELIIGIDNASGSDWTSTLNGAPVGAVVTYNVPLTAGSEDTIVPVGATELGKLVLWNTSKAPDEYALIVSVNTGANTITVSNAADVAGWLNGEIIEVRSQTNTAAPSGVRFFDCQIETTDVIPALTTELGVHFNIKDTGGAGETCWVHPWETDSAAKRQPVGTQVANQWLQFAAMSIPLIQRRFCFARTASGAGTLSFRLKIVEVVEAGP